MCTATQRAQMPKLPYHVKLNTSLDLLNTMGLACPYVTNNSGKPACDKSKSYVLLANYDDKTLLRDWSASALANAIPHVGNGYLTSPSQFAQPQRQYCSIDAELGAAFAFSSSCI